MSSKTTQRWDWAIGLDLTQLNDDHLQQAYKLNWDNLCKFDNCRKNCKRILCLACFDRTWVDNESANNSNYDNFDTTNCEQKRTDPKSFVGLKNLGATCYVNCLLQLWFHNPALRKAIYEWDKNLETNETQRSHQKQASFDSGGQKMITNDHSGEQQSSSSIVSRTSSSPSSSTSSSSKTTPVKRLKTDHDDELQIVKAIKSTDCNNDTLDDDNKKKVSLASDSKTLSLSPSIEATSNKSQTTKKSKDSTVQTNPIEQLQLIFARLQFTNKKSIDPFNFIESLALNAAEQQDAQEFGNLFFEFLEKSFANQKNTFVSNIIKNQFLGRYSYATICDHCKHSSVSDSNFYELDLSIQNLETLHDCLDEYFRPVPLDGKYNCSHCRKAQSAHRKIILKSLPPTLNLQLLRFVYDKQRNTRQKLNSFIIFPEILDMNSYLSESSNNKIRMNPFDLSARGNNYDYHSNGISRNRSNIYILSAVLIHRGSSPHSGHYIAHIKDRVTKDWFKFNDDSVERIGPQLQVSTDGENITIVEDKTETIKFNDFATGKAIRMESKSLKSKTAYMLVYQAHDNEALTYPSDHSNQWQLPEHLQCAVLEENSKSDELFESLQIAKEVDEQVMNVRKQQIRTIYEKLVCRDPKEKFEFIDRAWLQNWLTNSSSSAKFPKIESSHLLCIHNKLDFRKLDQVKCVRTEGADLLYKEFGGSGPRLQDAMCHRCVELEIKLIHLKERLKEDQKFITSQAKFKLDAGYDFEDAFAVGKNSYRDWQALVMVQFEKSNPELAARGRGERGNQSSDEDENKNNEKTDKSESSTKASRNEDADASDSESDDEAIEKFVFNSDVLCEHNQLINDPMAWRIVPKEVWMIFKRYFGNDPEKPLIELNANTLMCAECKKQEVEQQAIGDEQKQRASSQKSKLYDLFQNKKRASWCSMVPGDEYYALDRQFLTKWQKFLRNPCNQEQPTTVKHLDKIACKHGKSLYNHSNSNPLLPECSFVLVSQAELNNLKEFYPVDYEIKFIIDTKLANAKLKQYIATQKASPSKKASQGANNTEPIGALRQLDNSGDHNSGQATVVNLTDTEQNQISVAQAASTDSQLEDIDFTDIDWTDCVVSEPGYCSECHELLKQDELKRLLNYESATIYVTKCESRTARRNRSREQAYTIKPTQTLLELKKEIFSRCQVLPVDQRLFLNDVLLDDNTKTMSELRIVPNCSLKLEVSSYPLLVVSG